MTHCCRLPFWPFSVSMKPGNWDTDPWTELDPYL
jgi:hypothetical protein